MVRSRALVVPCGSKCLKENKQIRLRKTLGTWPEHSRNEIMGNLRKASPPRSPGETLTSFLRRFEQLSE